MNQADICSYIFPWGFNNSAPVFYGYMLWNETLVKIQSCFIASIEMRGRNKTAEEAN